MTATVISLSSRRRHRVPADGCESCQHRSDGQLCYSHRVAAASAHLSVLLDNTEGELLIDRETVAREITAARGLLDTVVAETLAADERPAR